MARLAAYTNTPPPVARKNKAKTKKTESKTTRGPSKRKGKKAPAKFRDPETGNSWSGRGLTPVWLRDYETAGGNRADLAV
jgi:DNA-binding protein H-NS